jgi:hypothetical protein
MKSRLTGKNVATSLIALATSALLGFDVNAAPAATNVVVTNTPLPVTFGNTAVPVLLPATSKAFQGNLFHNAPVSPVIDVSHCSKIGLNLAGFAESILIRDGDNFPLDGISGTVFFDSPTYTKLYDVPGLSLTVNAFGLGPNGLDVNVYCSAT